MTHRQIVVAELPQGQLEEKHFRLEDAEIAAIGAGDVRLRVILMSIDAANRAWMQGATYRAPVNAGDPMPTYAICEVMEARTPRFSPGDIVAAEVVWAEEVIRKDTQIQKLDAVPRLENLLSVYGIAGKTAYHGLVSVGRPKRGETIVVSAAAGSVGGYVGQIGKALGCRVVGIAGGAEKCAWVKEHLG
ncbi:MAG: NADP-dependent oxidoreductase, partial [Rhodobacteraceae bacterium]|nr:NADP-dependent oxidoreductase [Paracoccaceae bacterium]